MIVRAFAGITIFAVVGAGLVFSGVGGSSPSDTAQAFKTLSTEMPKIRTEIKSVMSMFDAMQRQDALARDLGSPLYGDLLGVAVVGQRCKYPDLIKQADRAMSYEIKRRNLVTHSTLKELVAALIKDGSNTSERTNCPLEVSRSETTLAKYPKL